MVLAQNAVNKAYKDRGLGRPGRRSVASFTDTCKTLIPEQVCDAVELEACIGDALDFLFLPRVSRLRGPLPGGACSHRGVGVSFPCI